MDVGTIITVVSIVFSGGIVYGGLASKVKRSATKEEVGEMLMGQRLHIERFITQKFAELDNRVDYLETRVAVLEDRKSA